MNDLYKENPSIKQAMRNTKKGAKLIFGNNNETQVSVYNEDEEDFNKLTLQFSAKQVVDKDQFIKIYINALPVLSDLKNSSKLLFQYILGLVNEEIGKDRVYVSYQDYLDKSEKFPLMAKLSKATFFRAINELLTKEVLFKSNLTSIYFINISYVFNGDRLRFINEYVKKKDEND